MSAVPSEAFSAEPPLAAVTKAAVSEVKSALSDAISASWSRSASFSERLPPGDVAAAVGQPDAGVGDDADLRVEHGAEAVDVAVGVLGEDRLAAVARGAGPARGDVGLAVGGVRGGPVVRRGDDARDEIRAATAVVVEDVRVLLEVGVVVGVVAERRVAAAVGDGEPDVGDERELRVEHEAVAVDVAVGLLADVGLALVARGRSVARGDGGEAVGGVRGLAVVRGDERAGDEGIRRKGVALADLGLLVRRTSC